MSKKKRFGISEALTRGLSETIHVVENNTGIYRNIVLPISRIELDPDNPRKLAVTMIDVQQGLQASDPLYAEKQQELEKLKELAHTIKSSGVINPIIVYKPGEMYRVVAGERRCLASILANKKEIEARVFNEKPKGFDLKLIQWIENTAREDLTLAERLNNVRDIITAYQQQEGEVETNATLLKTITGLSLSQSSYYLAVLDAPLDVKMEIEKGNIRNLDKAALLSSIPTVEVRQQAIEACINGTSLRELRYLVNQQKSLKKKEVLPSAVARGRKVEKINLGATPQSEVVKAIVDCVVTHEKFEKHSDQFIQVNWKDFRQATKAFRKLVEILEIEMAI